MNQATQRNTLLTVALTAALVSLGAISACGGGNGSTAQNDGTAQLPPIGGSAVESWLTQGTYTSWHCEPAAHAARSPSPHGFNRICSNDLLSTAGAGEFPVGAASVKELLDSSSANATITGYAVSRHTNAGTSGSDWYWYERNASGAVADGKGDSDTALTICVGCHTGAGSDANHSGHDFVYTQVH